MKPTKLDISSRSTESKPHLWPGDLQRHREHVRRRPQDGVSLFIPGKSSSRVARENWGDQLVKTGVKTCQNYIHQSFCLKGRRAPINLNPQIFNLQSLAAKPVKCADAETGFCFRQFARENRGLVLLFMLVSPNLHMVGMENSEVKHRCSMVTINHHKPLWVGEQVVVGWADYPSCGGTTWPRWIDSGQDGPSFHVSHTKTPRSYAVDGKATGSSTLRMFGGGTSNGIISGGQLHMDLTLYSLMKRCSGAASPEFC